MIEVFVLLGCWLVGGLFVCDHRCFRAVKRFA